MRQEQKASKLPTNTRLTLLAGLGLCLSFTGLADTVDDTNLEVITVSATPVPISEAGSSVSIITAEDILIKNAATLQELLREVPGFAVSQFGSSGSLTQVRVRGAEGNQVLVLIDGIEANDIAQGGEFNFSHLLTTGIERIEIVRGPQSSLWGSDAMAGVVHIITRSQATAPGTNFGINAETSSFGTVRGSFSVSHRTADARISASVESLNTDGTNISRTGNEDDGFENTTVSLAGGYQLADTFTLSFTARHTDTTTAFDTSGPAGLPIDADLETNSTYQYLGVNFKHDINDGIAQRLNLARFRSNNRSDPTAGQIKDVTRGTKDTARYQLDLARAAQRLSVLAEHETEDFRQRGASPFGDPNQNREIKTTSLALEYRYDGERVNLSASARRDDNSDFKNASSWRVTGNWLLGNNDIILFASVGKSIKNPTFTERFGFFRNFIGNPNLEPEESSGWEVGIKHSWLEGRLSAGLAWFNADLDNEINGSVYVPDQGAFTAENSDGESNRSGVELEAAWSPIENLGLTATYTYLDATQEDSTGRDVTEVRRPEHSGAFAATYRWNTDSGKKAAIHLAVSHTGTQEDDFFPPVPPYRQRVELGSFTLVSLSGHYQMTRNITLTGRLENIGDKNYEQVYGYRSPGANGHVGIRFAW